MSSYVFINVCLLSNKHSIDVDKYKHYLNIYYCNKSQIFIKTYTGYTLFLMIMNEFKT